MSQNEHLHPGDLLSHAFELINARGDEYDRVGSLEQNYREAAAVASIVTGIALSARDVAMVLHCVKLLRAKSSPQKIDTYVDAMNYLAFAACFSGAAPLPDLVEPRPPTRLSEVNEAARREYNSLRNIYAAPEPAAAAE